MKLALLLLLSLLPATCRARLMVASAATPISKVTTLLKDMQMQLEKEAEEDESIHERMTCWCEKNEPKTVKSIADGEATVEDLLALIESTAAGSARLRQEIENHEQELAKSKTSLDTATTLREQQAADFTAEEKDMVQSIKALDAAIVVISRHHAQTSFLDNGDVIAKALQVAREEMKKHQKLMLGSITPKQRHVLALAQGQQPTFRQAYTPQSGEIFGILKQMKETFETNLAESQKEELANKNAYEALKAAKQEEIAATQGAIDEKKMQLAESDEKNAQAKQDVADTKQMLVEENGMLITIKEKCKMSNEEYESRTKLRQEEISAIVQAISILTSDEARDQFSKSFTPTMLLQVHTIRRSDDRRSEAVAVLRAAAAKSEHGSKLAELAAFAGSASLDAFTRVKEAIDKMVEELIQEKKDEITHRDNCITELNENEKLTEREERTKSDLQSKEEGLKTLISDLTEEINTLNSEISDLNVQIKRKGEDRELQNKDFQATVADHRETQKLLQKALAVLNAVYAKAPVVTTEAPLLLQISQPTIVPPEGFTKYERSDAGGGVLALIEQILNDAVAMEKEVVKDEQLMQEDYEAFVKATNKDIESKQATIVTKTGQRGKAEQDLGVTEEDIRTSVTELQQLSTTAAALHGSCDFILKNFELRQEARDQEVEALRQAKAILSGMQLD